MVPEETTRADKPAARAPEINPLSAKALKGMIGSKEGVIRAPDKIPAMRNNTPIHPLDHALESENTSGPIPERITTAMAAIKAGFADILSSMGVKTSLSIKEKVTCRIFESAFRWFFRNAGISLALTGP